MAIWAGRGNQPLRAALEGELRAAHDGTRGGTYFASHSANGVSFSRAFVAANTPVDELEMLGYLLRFYDDLAAIIGDDEQAIYREMVDTLRTPCDSFIISHQNSRSM